MSIFFCNFAAKIIANTTLYEKTIFIPHALATGDDRMGECHIASKYR